MKLIKNTLFLCVIGFAACLISWQAVWAGDIISNDIEPLDLLKIKKPLDDSTPYFKKVNYYKDLVSQETWDMMSHKSGEAKAAWENAVGFKSPDLTGKIASEIKPGKYKLADKEQSGLKSLMPAHFYDRFNEPGAQGDKFGGNFTEFEVIPTRQYYFSHNLAMNTINNQGKAQQDEKGYPLQVTFETGMPFPRPSGPFKAWQVVTNMDSKARYFESLLGISFDIGIDSSLKQDREGLIKYYEVRLARRSNQTPLGRWYDARAEKRKESFATIVYSLAPRDVFGTAYSVVSYDDDKDENWLVYTPLLRRLRKMSGSDKQDSAVGLDYAYDDDGMFNQDLDPKKFPYEVKILEEREFLLPAATIDGESWVDSKSGFQWKDLKMERRPCYLIEMKQLDSQYIYSKRLYWVDKETFVPYLGEFYDQKGRLWRSMQCQWAFNPELGTYIYNQVWSFDHIDKHTTYQVLYEYPGENFDRNEISPKRLMRAVK